MGTERLPESLQKMHVGAKLQFRDPIHEKQRERSRRYRERVKWYLEHGGKPPECVDTGAERRNGG